MTTSGPETFPRPLLALMALFAMAVLTLPLIFWFRLEYYEVCPVCARVRDVQDWLIPFTRAPYYTFATIEDSPLTTRLIDYGYVDEHPHKWLLVRGSGPGTTDIMGEGLRVVAGLTTPSIAPFVDLLHQHTDPATEAYWFARMTHPQQADFVRNVADRCTKETFADAGTFRKRLAETTTFQRQLLTFRLGRINEPESRTQPRLLNQPASR